MKNDRLFRIIYLLLEKGSMSAPVLAKQLEVSVRTVYRDVESLSMAGVPIYTTTGKNGGISLIEGYSIDKTLLSDKEQNKLLFALQSLKATDQEVDSLLSKLGAAFQKPSQNWISVDFSRWGLRRTDTERFEQLKTAILNCQTLSLTYCDASSKKTQRIVLPLRMVYKDKDWYLQAYCQRVKDFRTFKIGRILAAVPTGDTFAQIDVADIPPFETEAPSGYGKTISLRFSPQVAFRVYDDFGPDSITEEANGYLRVQVDFPIDSWVVSYLLTFGTEVEILSPVDLRKEIATYVEKIAAHYKP